MRWFGVFFAVSACGGSTAAPRAVPLSAPLAPPPHAAESKTTNTTGLDVEPRATPSSRASVRFLAPVAGARLARADARSYEVRWAGENLDSDGLGVDVALDSYRPRRVPAQAGLIALGTLVPAGEDLSSGEHWLFAAPIAASGLVPQRAAGAPRSAVALRFSLGDAASSSASSGAVWLREPEGTYNGTNREHVLFEAIAFSAGGAPLASACGIRLAGKQSGELDFPGPFSIARLDSGDYEITASAAGAAATRAITVNAELGSPK